VEFALGLGVVDSFAFASLVVDKHGRWHLRRWSFDEWVEVVVVVVVVD